MASYSSISAVAVSFFLLGSVFHANSASADSPTLTGNVWQLQQIRYNNDTLLEANPPENYTLEFMDNGDISIRADCNFARGTYTEDGGSLSIALGPSTLAACPPDSIDSEYLQGLSSAAIYFFRDGDLYFDLMADTGTMQFSAASEAQVANQDSSGQDESGQAESVRALW